MPSFNAAASIIGLCLTLILTLVTAAPPLQPLSDAEADAIIAAEAAAKAERHRAALESLMSVPALSEGSYTTPSGTTMIVREIERPTKPRAIKPRRQKPAKQAPTAPRPDSSAPPVAILPQSMLMLQATVYDGPQTHLTWQNAGAAHAVTLPVDWRAVAEIKNVQTPNARYMLLHSVCKAPAGSSPPSGVGAKLDDPSLPEPLPSLMATYQAKREQLQILAQRRAALSAARERHQAQNPPQPETHILNIYDLHEPPQP
jgi:hypothetical protein